MTTVRNLILRLMLLLVDAAALGQGKYMQIDVPGALATVPHGINSNGEIIGSYLDAMGRWHAFLGSFGSALYETIDAPNATDTYAMGINNLGQIVGTTDDGHGFVYDPSTRHFGDVLFPGSNFTVPTCISNSGTIAGYVKHFGLYEGFELVGSTYSTIVPPGATTTFPSGITYNDTIVGSANIRRALTNINFVFYQGQFKPLMVPGSQPGVNGVAENGIAIVGNYQPSPGVSAGFMWNNVTFQTLIFPGAIETGATGISDETIVVGYFFDSNNVQHGFTREPAVGVMK